MYRFSQLIQHPNTTDDDAVMNLYLIPIYLHIFYLIVFSISSLTVSNLSSLQPSCCQTRIGISPFTPSPFSIQHVEMHNGCLLRQFHFHHLQHVAYSRCSTYRFVNNNVLGLCRHRQQQGTDHQYILHKFILHLLLL